MVKLDRIVIVSKAIKLGASACLIGLCLIGPSTLSINQGLALIASISIGAVIPGYCLTFYSQPVTRTERLLLAAVYGTILWSLGVFLSSFFGFDAIRYAPSLYCFFWSLSRFRSKKEPSLFIRENAGDNATIIGGLAGVAVLLPSLTKTLSLQRTDWMDYWSFNIDLPFHISLVSEAAQRIPKVYPYVDDTDLRYTWLTHGSLGFLSRISRVPAFELVLQFWPVLAASTLSFLIAALAWKVTSSCLATVAAPLIAACLRGPRLGMSSYLDFHLLAPYSLSRDLGTIWLLIFVLHLMRKPLNPSSGRRSIVIDTAMVLLITFALSGGKGSMLPLVLGSLLGGALFIFLFHKQLFSQTIRILLASAVGLFLSQVLVVKSSGHLQIEIFSFIDAIPGVTDKWAILWLVLPLILALLILFQKVLTRQTMNLGSWVLGLLPLVGLGGLTIFGHPGKSQLIFWMTTVPFFAVGLAALLSVFYRHTDKIEKLIAVVAWFSGPLIGKVMNQVNDTQQYIWTLAACSICSVFIFLKRMMTSKDERVQFWKFAPAVVAVVFLGGLQLKVDKGLAYDTGPSPGGQVALHQEQLIALKFLRHESSPSERFITNKHCIGGSLANKDCYSRWFLASAISERRTPIEGYSYTWRNVDGPYWNAQNLTRFDDFIVNPTWEQSKRLLAENIHWIYIDTKEPFSASLDEVGTLVYDGEFAKLYHLG
jgi:hypothetical protein